MNKLVQYDSSSEEDEPKKVKIFVDKPAEAEYKRKFNPKSNDTLLKALPVPSTKSASAAFDRTTASMSSKRKIPEEEEEEEYREEIVDFFSARIMKLI